MPQDLADEERVTAGLCGYLTGQRDTGRLEVLPDSGSDQLSDLALRQTLECKPFHPLLAMQLGERRRERVIPGKLRVTVRTDYEEAGARELGGKVPQQRERGLVGPM